MLDATKSPARAEILGNQGPLQGPSYRYRGAIIDGNVSGSLFRISLPGHVLDGWKGMCRLGEALALVDAALRNPSER